MTDETPEEPICVSLTRDEALEVNTYLYLGEPFTPAIERAFHKIAAALQAKATETPERS